MSGLGIIVCLFSFIATHLLSYGHQCKQIVAKTRERSFLLRLMWFSPHNSRVGACIFGHSTIVIFFPCALVSFHFARIGLVLVPCRSAYAAIADTIQGHKKTSLRISTEAVRSAYTEIQREANALCVSSAKYRP